MIIVTENRSFAPMIHPANNNRLQRKHWPFIVAIRFPNTGETQVYNQIDNTTREYWGDYDSSYDNILCYYENMSLLRIALPMWKKRAEMLNLEFVVSILKP